MSLVIDELQLLGVVPKPAAPEPVVEAVPVEVSEPEPEPEAPTLDEVAPPEVAPETADRLVEAIDKLQMKLCDLAAAVIQAAREFGEIAESVRGTDGEVIEEHSEEANGEAVQS